MSYINEIDVLIYESINEIYADLKNEKFTKIRTFGKEDSYLKTMEKYINKNESKKKIKDLLKNRIFLIKQCAINLTHSRLLRLDLVKE